MQALVINEHGGVDKFQKTDVPTPKVDNDELLVETHAFSVNPMDIAGRQGILPKEFTSKWKTFPIILGWDVAGKVVKKGANVKNFQVGDAIFAELPTSHSNLNGAYADYAVVKEGQTALKPPSLSFDQAAALPIAGGTAYKAIEKNLKVKASDKLLIQGGAGGVGLFAIQLARNLGAHIATTASPNHKKLLEDLGADQVINYHKTPVSQVLSNYDKVFDTVGDITQGFQALKNGGQLVTIIGQPTDAQLHDPTKGFMFQMGPETAKDISGFFGWQGKNQIQIIISKTYPYTVSGIKAAHRQIETHHTTGKLVVHVKD